MDREAKMKKMIAIFLTAVLLMTVCGPAAFAGSPEGSMPDRQSEAEDIPVIIDVLVLRPAGLVACVVGLVSALIALPFAIPSDSMDEVSQVLIQEPYDYTFKRPLGKNIQKEPL
jgi:hypothetical protein